MNWPHDAGRRSGGKRTHMGVSLPQFTLDIGLFGICLLDILAGKEAEGVA